MTFRQPSPTGLTGEPAISQDAPAGPIVVGIDETAAAAAALNWACQESARLGAGLLLVHAYNPEAARYSPSGDRLLPVPRQVAMRTLARAIRSAHDVAPDVSVRSRLVPADPVIALQHAADNAVLTVLGATAGHRIRDALLGSPGYRTATSVHRPVLLVHEADDYQPAGLVVAGVDGTPNSVAACLYAADSAARAGAALLLVHGADPAELTAAGEAGLLGLVERCRTRHPELSVCRRSVLAYPGEALVDASARARMLVVGTHGRPAVGRFMLGSISQYVIRAATCPVAVVRPPALT